MLLVKAIRPRSFQPLLNIHTPWICPRFIPVIPSNSDQISCPCYVLWRPFSLSTKNSEDNRDNSVHPLRAHFKGAVGILDRGDQKTALDTDGDSSKAKLKDGSKKLEEQVRNLNKKKREKGTTPNQPKDVKRIVVNGILRAIFHTSKTKEMILMELTDSPADHRVLSPDMQMVAHHLYLKGYLRNANFISQSTFDLTSFQQPYARGFLKFAAVEFGKDHSEIVKWLSASDLKKVANFGCPSTNRKSVYASKYIRRFFQMNEFKVCQKCPLIKACSHAKKPPRKDCSALNLRTVMSVVIMYALGSVPQELVVPEEVKRSVSRLLKEIIDLTRSQS